MPTVREIVRELGGSEYVGRFCWSNSPRGYLGKAAVSMWKQVPAEHCLAIQVLSKGKYQKHELRPDKFPAPSLGA